MLERIAPFSIASIDKCFELEREIRSNTGSTRAYLSCNTPLDLVLSSYHAEIIKLRRTELLITKSIIKDLSREIHGLCAEPWTPEKYYTHNGKGDE